jgi:hypothetical protein
MGNMTRRLDAFTREDYKISSSPDADRPQAGTGDTPPSKVRGFRRDGFGRLGLLSDRAGLDSIYMTGSAYAVGHTWNKTFMDGKWQVVKPTWHDSEFRLNALIGMTDEVAKTDLGHTFGSSGWRIPTMAAQ